MNPEFPKSSLMPYLLSKEERKEKELESKKINRKFISNLSNKPRRKK